MKLMICGSMISMLLVSGVGYAATRSTPVDRSASITHYTEHTCAFGQYGLVTVHEGGIGNTYIVVRGKRYPSTGGENFVQSNDDDNVAVMFDRKGNMSYRGEVPGRNCHVTHR